MAYTSVPDPVLTIFNKAEFSKVSRSVFNFTHILKIIPIFSFGNCQVLSVCKGIISDLFGDGVIEKILTFRYRQCINFFYGTH